MKITYSTPFTIVENNIIQNRELNIYQKMVYIVLCSHSNDNNTCFPSYATIAKEVGCSKRKIISVISELAELGVIEVSQNKTKNGKNTSNSYKLLPVDNSAIGAQDAMINEYDAPSDSESPAPDSECGAHELYSDNNINSFNNNQSIISKILEKAKLENFHKPNDRQLYKIVLEKMYNSKNITVEGNTAPQKDVREQLRKIDYEVMAGAHDSIQYKAVANKVRYLMSVIYNALLLKVDYNTGLAGPF